MSTFTNYHHKQYWNVNRLFTSSELREAMLQKIYVMKRQTLLDINTSKLSGGRDTGIVQ